MGGCGVGGNVNKIIGILKKYSEYGVSFAELIVMSGMFSCDLDAVFDELDDSGYLHVRTDGESKLYKLKKG